jgi:hypothetical protein
MYTQCPRCGAMLADPGRDFPCPRCGARVRSAGGGFVADEEAMGPLASVHMSGEPGWKALLRALQQLSRLGAFVLFYVSMLLCFSALFVGIPLVLGGAPGSDYQAVLYVLTPAPLGLFGFGGGALAAYHIFLSAVIIASFAWLMYTERQKIRPLLSDSAARFRSPDRQSPLGVVQLPQVFLAIFFFDILFAIIIALTGTTTRAPAFETYPDWYLYFTFANASVYEEFAARTLLLGVPLLLAYVLAFGRQGRPDRRAGRLPFGPDVVFPPTAPVAVPLPPPRPDALIDVPADDLSTRLVPKPGDASAPVASTPAFGAPAPEAPPVQGPGLVYPRVPDKDQALILATTQRPVPESLSPPTLPPKPATPSEGPGPGWVTGDVIVPPPPPVVKPPGWEPLRPPARFQPPPRPTLAGYLRSRSTNGMWGFLLGGGFKIGPLEAFFITGSALMFGLAHVAGWDMFKALPTFVAGLGFGYLFLKVGIHAAILLHFAFDYLSLGQALLPGFGLMELLLLVLFAIVGAFYFGHYAVQAARWFREQTGQAEHGQ